MIFWKLKVSKSQKHFFWNSIAQKTTKMFDRAFYVIEAHINSYFEDSIKFNFESLDSLYNKISISQKL